MGGNKEALGGIEAGKGSGGVWAPIVLDELAGTLLPWDRHGPESAVGIGI